MFTKRAATHRCLLVISPSALSAMSPKREQFLVKSYEYSVPIAHIKSRHKILVCFTIILFHNGPQKRRKGSETISHTGLV
jgi:hypothetical protein